MKKMIYLIAACTLILNACKNKQPSPSEELKDSTSVAANEEQGPKISDVDLTPIVNPLPCSADALEKGWKEAAKQCYMEDWTQLPEEYILFDVDGDGIKELIVRGQGLYAAFLVDEGKLQLLCTAFGEYSSLSVAPYTIIQNTESGQQAGWGTTTYYQIHQSNLNAYVIKTIGGTDEDLPPVTTYMLGEGFIENPQAVEEEYALPYIPQQEPVLINYFTEEWQAIK